MKKIVLIGCSQKKSDSKEEVKAEDLYCSPLFIKSLKYAKLIKPEKIFILSAKYGLLRLSEKIKTYDKTLNKMKSDEKKCWAKEVIKKLKKKCDLDNDEFIFLAGKEYRKYLIPSISKYKIPMNGKRIGEQLKWLNKNIQKMEVKK